MQHLLHALWLANSPEIEDNYIIKWQNRYCFPSNEKCGSKTHQYTSEISSCNPRLITHSYFLYRTILFWICILNPRSSSFGRNWDSSSNFNITMPTCITYRSSQNSTKRGNPTVLTIQNRIFVVQTTLNIKENKARGKDPNTKLIFLSQGFVFTVVSG